MNPSGRQPPYVAIACGGTGGHLFPGLAVAEQIRRRGGEVALLISPKDIDQQAVKAAAGLAVFTLPAVGLQNRNYLPFLASFGKSLFAARRLFRQRRPDAVLAMGGFTSAPPVWAGRSLGAKTFLHESNTIPGRANRLLARYVDAAFVGFPEAAARLKTRRTQVTGTPVRPQFSPALRRADAAARCRAALGLSPELPTVLVVGGSQGARGLNHLVTSALPLLAQKNWQWLHLAGANDFETVRAAYAARKIKAVVKPFLAEMDLALGAATAAVSRAGASSLAEIAATRLPALLVPLPTAADNHQFFNAAAFEQSGAARRLDQPGATPEAFAAQVIELMENEPIRQTMQASLAQWHAPDAAEQIAQAIFRALGNDCEPPAEPREKLAPGGSAKFSPHPDLLPQGEGTAVAVADKIRESFEQLPAFVWPNRWNRFSLSQRERAGVRENAPTHHAAIRFLVAQKVSA